MKKSTIYKIAGGSAAVVTVAAPTLGVVLGTKDWTYHNPMRSPQSETEEFFDSNIASAKSTYLTEKIVNPTGGSDLSSSYVILDSAWMDFNHILEMSEKDEKGNPIDITQRMIDRISKERLKGEFNFTDDEIKRLSLGTLNFDAINFTSPKDLEVKLLAVNKMLSAYNNMLAKDGQHEKIGLYVYPVYNTRSVAIRIYKLKEFEQDDRLLINDFMKQLKFPDAATSMDPQIQKWIDNAKKAPSDATKDADWQNDFVQMFGGEHFLESGYALKDWYKLYPSREEAFSAMGNFKHPMPYTTDADKSAAFESAKQENIQLLPHGGHPGNDWYTPIEMPNKFTGEHEYAYGLRSFYDKNMIITHKPIIDLVSKEFKIVFTFYKFDKTSIFNNALVQRVFNPTNIETVVKSMPLSIFGDTTSKVRPNDITDADRELFEKMMIDPKANSFINWIHRPLTEPGLDILGTVLPSIKSPAASMIKLFRKAEELDKAYPGKFRDDLFSKENVTKLFERMQADDSIKASEFWRICIEDFQTDIDSFWSSLDKLTNLDRPGIYKLYTMFAGFHIVSDWMDEFIKNSPDYKNFTFKSEDSSALSSLIFALKRQGIVDNDFTIQNVLDAPKEAIKRILDGILKAKTFSLEPKYAQIILGLVTQYVKLPDGVADKLEGPLEEFISSKDGLQKLVKFILGKHTPDDVINAVFTGNYLKIVEYMATNNQVDFTLIQTVSKLAEASGYIPSNIASILPTSESSAKMVADIFNKGGMSGIYDIVDKLITQGVGSLTQANISETIKKVRDSVAPSKSVVDLLNIFNVKNVFELLGTVADIEKIVKTMTTWGDIKTLVAKIDEKLNPNTTVHIGNQGKTVYDVLHHIKELVDQVNVDDKSTLTDAIQALTSKTGNGAKLIQSVMGLIVYIGSDKIDKSNDPIYPLLTTFIGALTKSIKWDDKSVTDILGFVPAIIEGGYDYDDQGNGVHDFTVDGFIKHIFDQSKILGFDIDAYKAEIPSTAAGQGKWIDSFFGEFDAQGNLVSIPVRDLLEHAASEAGNPVRTIAAYLSDNTIDTTVAEIWKIVQSGLGSVTEENIEETLNVVNLAAGQSIDTKVFAPVIYKLLKQGIPHRDSLGDDVWKMIGDTVKSATGTDAVSSDLIKNALYGFGIDSKVIPEGIARSLLYGFGSVDNFKNTLNNLVPGLWDTKVDLTISAPTSPEIHMNLADLLTSIYNHNLTSNFNITKNTLLGLAGFPPLVRAHANDLGLLLQKGLLGLTGDEINKVSAALKAILGDLKTFFEWKIDAFGIHENILDHLPDSIKPYAPMVTSLYNLVNEMGDGFTTLLQDVQAVLKGGLLAAPQDKLENVEKQVQVLLAKVKVAIPSLATNEIVTKVESWLGDSKEPINAVVADIQKLFNGGLMSLTKDDISSLINSVREILPKLRTEIPSLSSNATFLGIEKVINLLKDSGDEIYNILHQGLSGTVEQNVLVSQLVVGLLKELAPSIPSVLMDYIPKLVSGQDNIEDLKNTITTKLATLTIESEVQTIDGVVVPTNYGKYSQFVTEANTQLNIAKDSNKQVAERLEALSQYQLQLNAIHQYNEKVTKLNAAKTALNNILANLNNYQATLASTIDKTQTFAANLKATDFVLPHADGFEFKVTSYAVEGADKSTAVLSLEIVSSAYSQFNAKYECRISGFKAQTALLPSEVADKFTELINKHATELGGTQPYQIYNKYQSSSSSMNNFINEFKAYLIKNFPTAAKEVNALIPSDFVHSVRGQNDHGLFVILAANRNVDSFSSISVSTANAKDAASVTRIKALFAALSK